MEFRKIGGIEVSTIGMGSFKSFDVRSEGDIAIRHEIIDNCIANGVTLIDSSPMYGNSERIIGITTQGKRDKFKLATKVWTTGKQEGQRQIAQSFELMKTDYVDVFQIHNLVDWRTQLTTLEGLKEQGKIGAIGITHYTTSSYPQMMDIMRSGRIDSVQVPYNVMERACESKLLPLAQEFGIGVIVMEPLEQGRYVRGLKRQPDLSPLSEYGIQTWAQALLAWVISDSRVTTAIPATSRPERIAENAYAGTIGNLPQELRDYIRDETVRSL